jgi:Arc/MetJ family transcription regulator
MRTTVDLPEDLLEEARRVTDSKTKRETIVRALVSRSRDAGSRPA